MAKQKAGKPAKKPMAHKPLVKKEAPPHLTVVSPAKLARPVTPSLRQASAIITAPQSARQSEGLRVIQGLIALLPNAIFDPEKSYGEIFSKYHKLGMQVDPATEQAINDKRFTAHANRIAHLLNLMPTHENPQVIANQIAESLRILTHYQKEAYVFTVAGVTDRTGLDAKIKEAADAAEARIAEQKLQVQVENAIVHWRMMLREEHDADTRRQAFMNALDGLGENQHRAFPKGIKTREEMDTQIQIQYDAAKARVAAAALNRQIRILRDQYCELKRKDFSYLTPGNPDATVAAIREGVKTLLDGDIAKLDYWHDSTAVKVEENIDAGHSSIMHHHADELLKKRGREKPYFGYFSEVSSLNKAQQLLAAGYYPDQFLREQNEGIQTFWSSTNAPKPTAGEVQTIKDQAAQNEAVRFAMVTQHFAALGEVFAGMLAKTLQRIEAAGGFDAVVPAVERVGLTADEWNALKTFLTEQKTLLAEKQAQPVFAEMAATNVQSDGVPVTDGTAETADAAEADATAIEIAIEDAPVIGESVETNFGHVAAELVDSADPIEPDAPEVPQPAFDLYDSDSIIAALAADDFVAQDVYASIEAISDWNEKLISSLDKIYRARIQQLLSIADNVQMDDFADHLSSVQNMLIDTKLVFRIRLSTFEDVVRDTVNYFRLPELALQNGAGHAVMTGDDRLRLG